MLAQAALIVTGDKGLLQMNGLHGIRVILPKAFTEWALPPQPD